VKYDKVALYLLDVVKAQQQRIGQLEHDAAEAETQRCADLKRAAAESEALDARVQRLEAALQALVPDPEVPATADRN
jgi:hypothetical protein